MVNPMQIRWLLLPLLWLSWATPTLAIDDSSRASARALVNEGVALFKEGHFEEAQHKFADALVVAKVPTVAVWAGRTHERLGHWVAASELFESALLMQPNELWVGDVQSQAQEQAREALQQLRPRIPTARINVTGAPIDGVEVTIDHVSIPVGLLARERPLDPGEHIVIAKRGHATVTKTVILQEREKAVLALALPPESGPEPSPTGKSEPKAKRLRDVESKAAQPASARLQKNLGWVSVGVGAAGLALGTTAAIIVGNMQSSLHNDGCVKDICVGDEFRARVEASNSWRTVSTTGFVVGAAGAVAGLSLLLSLPKPAPGPSAKLIFGPNSLSLHGSF